MLPVTDAFLLNIAEISAALVGLFLVGVFFFLETGFRRVRLSQAVLEPYFRASTRIVLALYAIPIILPLTLVVLEQGWNNLILAVLSVVLVASNVDTALRIRRVSRATRSTALVLNEIVGTIGVGLLVAVPWIAGRLHPDRQHLTLSILISFIVGFLSITATVMSAFDLARRDSDEFSAKES